MTWHAEDRDGFQWAVVKVPPHVAIRTRHKSSVTDPAKGATLAEFTDQEARALAAGLLAATGVWSDDAARPDTLENPG